VSTIIPHPYTPPLDNPIPNPLRPLPRAFGSCAPFLNRRRWDPPILPPPRATLSTATTLLPKSFLLSLTRYMTLCV
jgi:hypothetical protein